MSDESVGLCAQLVIQNRLGLHARAATAFTNVTSRFTDTEISVQKDDEIVDGKSLLGVMTLAAEQGSTIEVRAVGPQAAMALEAIRTLVASKFNEPE